MENLVAQKKNIGVRRLERTLRQFSDPERYQILWAADGIKSITIDFETTPIFPNSIVFITPGRQVELDLECKPPKGWILSFTREYFREQYLEGLNVRNADLFYSTGEIPRIVLSPKIGDRINSLVEMIAELNGSKIPNREMGISSLLNTLLVYCDSKCNVRVTHQSNSHEMNIVGLFKHYVSQYFLEKHLVSHYADLMHISPKYLNQIVKRVLGVSAKSVIQEQIMIQACRDLKFSGESIKEIAAKLGFSEPEHFSHFFKKETGVSPTIFRQQ